MIIHIALTNTLTAGTSDFSTLVDVQLLQQLQQRYKPSEFQLWGFVEEKISAQKDRLEGKLEQQLSILLNCSVECIFVEETTQLDVALIEVDRYMHWLAMHEPFEEMGFFTTQMDILQQAVLLEGIKTFEDRFHSLYFDADQHYTESPHQQSWLQLFQELVHEFDYVSALELLEEANLPNTHNVHALLTMQYARLNFDFQIAYTAFNKLTIPSNLTLLQTKMLLEALIGESSKDQAIAQITELYRQTKMLLIKEDWSSFLTRFYRAREAVLHFLLKYGANRQLTNRTSILALINQLEDDFEDGRITSYYGAYFYTKSANVARTLDIRNQSFIGHSRSPIHTGLLFEHYYGHRLKSSQMPERFLADAKIMLRELNSNLDSNLESINQLILEEMSKAAEELTR